MQVGSQAVIFKMKETKIMLVFNGGKTYRVKKSKEKVKSGDESVGKSGVGVAQTEKRSEVRRRVQKKKSLQKRKREGVESKGSCALEYLHLVQ